MEKSKKKEKTWMNGKFEIIDGVLKKYSGSDREIAIPEGVTSIGDRAFDNCGSLTKFCAQF